MPAFVWKGKTRDGKAVSGERVADNRDAVMALLRREQILFSFTEETRIWSRLSRAITASLFSATRSPETTFPSRVLPFQTKAGMGSS